MKNILRLLLLGVLGWLALSACAPTDKLAVGDAAKAPGKSDAVEGSIPSPNIVGEEGGLYPPQDLSLVTSTGRPQFLDSYADW